MKTSEQKINNRLHAKDTWSYLRENGNPMFQLLASLIPKECKSLLDVGCGEALILKHLLVDISYTGFDVSDYVINQNFRTYKEIYNHCPYYFHVSDMFNPSIHGDFDCLLFFGVFQNLSSLETLSLINLYIQRFNPHYILIENIKKTDLKILEKNFNVIKKVNQEFPFVDGDLPVGSKQILNSRQILLIKI